MTELLTRPNNSLEGVDTSKVFKFFSNGAVKALPKAENDAELRIFLTASTTATDLVGDVMTPKAMQIMCDAAPGTLMFLNHNYEIPESVLGTVESAVLVEREFPEGTPRLDLDYTVIVDQDNPRAIKAYNMVKNGRKLGASVSILVLDFESSEAGGMLINDLFYLETSLVGLPCNTDSWVQSAKTAIRKFFISSNNSHNSILTNPANEPGNSLAQQSLPQPDSARAALKTKTIRLSKKTLRDFLNSHDKEFTMKSKSTRRERYQQKKAAPKPQPRTNRQLVAKSAKPANRQAINKNKQKPPTKAAKGLFAAALAEQNAYDLYDYFWALQDAIGDLIDRAERGDSDDPVGEFNDLMGEFTQSIGSIVTPALQLNNSETNGEEEEEGEEDETGEEEETEKAFRRAKRFVSSKGRFGKASEDDEDEEDEDEDEDDTSSDDDDEEEDNKAEGDDDDDDDGDEDEDEDEEDDDDEGYAQEVHDHAVEMHDGAVDKGAKCDCYDKSSAKSAKNIQRLARQMKGLKQDRDEWKAAAEAALELAEQDLKKPLRSRGVPA